MQAIIGAPAVDAPAAAAGGAPKKKWAPVQKPWTNNAWICAHLWTGSYNRAAIWKIDQTYWSTLYILQTHHQCYTYIMPAVF